jgi:hypothetical protein
MARFFFRSVFTKTTKSIFLVPARTTNSQHLRDGFLRLFMQRMKDQSLSEDEEREILGAIQEFKSSFASMKVKKDTEFIFTKTKDGAFKMSYEVYIYLKFFVCVLLHKLIIVYYRARI